MLILALALAAAHPAHAFSKSKPRELAPRDVAQYYHDQTHDGVVPVPTQAGTREASAIAGIRFTQRGEFPQQLIPTRPIDAMLTQRLFRTDVRRMNQLMGGRDFVESETRFYSRLKYIHEQQAHERPYYYLSDWGQLFHPPVKRLELPIEEYFSGFAPGWEPAKHDSPYFDPAFQKAIDSRTGTALSYGNRVQLLANGQSFEAKLNLIRAARKSLHVTIMAWFCDGSGSKLLEAALERKRAGVDVRVITERIYAEAFTKLCIERMTDAGIPVLVVGDSLKGDTFSAVNHQKVWIRDGEEAIIGGQNILDYENESTGFNFMNRDQDLHVATGSPLVTDAVAAYARAWLRYPAPPHHESAHADMQRVLDGALARMADEESRGLRGQASYERWLSNPETRMNGVCRVALQGAGAKVQPIGPMLEAHLAKASHQVLLTTPDVPFNPHAEENAAFADSNAARIMRLLERQDGPEIRLLSNGLGGGAGEVSIFFKMRVEEARRNGGGLKQRVAQQMLDIVSRRAALANHNELKRLQAANARLKAYTYFQYIHAKLYLFDRTAAFVGSWNLDRNSGDLNHEAGVLCLDTSLEQQLERQLALDLSNTVPVVSSNGL